MTVGELISELSELDPSLPVLSARDEEGNGFNEVHNVYSGYKVEALGHYIENVIHQEDIDDVDTDQLEWWEDDYAGYDIDVVVIW